MQESKMIKGVTAKNLNVAYPPIVGGEASPAHLEIKALEENTRRLSELGEILISEMNKKCSLRDYLQLARALQNNGEAILKQTIAIHALRAKERELNALVVNPNGWEGL